MATARQALTDGAREEGSCDDARLWLRPTRTREAWAAMRWQWVHSECESVQACRRSALPGCQVDLELDSSGRARAQGVRTCGSVWACPLCSAGVWAERAGRLTHLLRAAEAEGLVVAFITLTMRHRADESLATLWDGMAPALSAALGAGSRTVQRLRREMGVLGIVRRTEATHGVNGWHLHPHLLVVAECGDILAFQELAHAMFTTWQSKLSKGGLLAPDDVHGWHCKVLDLSHAEEEAARYVTTAGSFHAAAEFADARGKSARMGNRTTWQLLEDAQGGDGPAICRWAEWERASKGRRAWDWRSPKLQALLAAHPPDQPDAADEEDRAPALVMTLSEDEWKDVCAHHDVVELLTEIEAAYREGLAKWCGDRGAALGEAAVAGHEVAVRWGVRPAGPP